MNFNACKVTMVFFKIPRRPQAPTALSQSSCASADCLAPPAGPDRGCPGGRRAQDSAARVTVELSHVTSRHVTDSAGSPSLSHPTLPLLPAGPAVRRLNSLHWPRTAFARPARQRVQDRGRPLRSRSYRKWLWNTLGPGAGDWCVELLEDGEAAAGRRG